MKKIAIYGKGGIGKSTTAANVSAAVAELGLRVLQVGCDPKHDSTRLLLGETCHKTVLGLLRQNGNHVKAEQVLHTGFKGVGCVEAGGPEPGVGCAGRGIIAAFEVLKKFNIEENYDAVLYDVLGDVVCGGFAVPIREGYATDVYILTSGEFMSLYAANNIAISITKSAQRGKAKLGGIIGIDRGVAHEQQLLQEFAEKINSRLVAFIPRDRIVHQAELKSKTVIELSPNSKQANVYRELAQYIITNNVLTIPAPMDFSDVEKLALRYSG